MSVHRRKVTPCMPSESSNAKRYLFHIRDNILYAQELLSGFTDDAFKLSRTHFYATTRALEIISEASRRPSVVEQELRELGELP